jgi:hypothetical protein
MGLEDDVVVLYAVSQLEDQAAVAKQHPDHKVDPKRMQINLTGKSIRICGSSGCRLHAGESASVYVGVVATSSLGLGRPSRGPSGVDPGEARREAAQI